MCFPSDHKEPDEHMSLRLRCAQGWIDDPESGSIALDENPLNFR